VCYGDRLRTEESMTVDAAVQVSDAADHTFWDVWVRVLRDAHMGPARHDALYLRARRDWERAGRPAEVYWWVVWWLDGPR
jgi:hypothetical protein